MKLIGNEWKRMILFHQNTWAQIKMKKIASRYFASIPAAMKSKSCIHNGIVHIPQSCVPCKADKHDL